MRWRGLRVRPFDGQTGSQKPHSMHLSTISSAAGSGLRFLRWICGSSLSTTSGLRMPLGSSSALELPHQLVALAAPLQLDEGRHVAAGAVFGLQRTAEFHATSCATSSMNARSVRLLPGR